MTNAIIESIVSRSTTKYFDPAVTLSDDRIRELVRIGTTAPTSFHLQNWHFIAVRTPEAKARLRPIAWDQPVITEAKSSDMIERRAVLKAAWVDYVAPPDGKGNVVRLGGKRQGQTQ
jgi:nitroreductase